MLDQGVIQHSRSPWNSPLFLVPQKDGSFRPVIDFRKVNKVTENDRYPLPVLGDLLMSLGQGNTIFSSLDLLSGHWHSGVATVARSTHNREVPGSIPERSGKTWAVFPIPSRPCSPSSE